MNRGMVLALVTIAFVLGTGCYSNDHKMPEVRFVFPQDGDTLDPGAYVLKTIATDNRGIYWVEFWARGEMVGITWRCKADTYRIGWDCRDDTFRNYYLSAVAEDWNDNWITTVVNVHVRR